jgi:hypothetical protein
MPELRQDFASKAVSMTAFGAIGSCEGPPQGSCVAVYFCSIIVRTVIIYLFICGLFNDAISTSDYIASNDRMINE